MEDVKDLWKQTESKFLFPIRNGHPYYIAAPRWIYASAGVRALHLLCAALRRMGYEAYITNIPYGEYREDWLSPEFHTPILTRDIARQHFESNRTPIALYPETISGNPLCSPVIARWVLNFPGLLGGDKTYDPNELCFGYSAELARAAGAPGRVLHLPTVDTRVFHPPEKEVPRTHGCFFASKYQEVHHGRLLPITDGCVEITRFRQDSQSPAQIAELLRRSEVFFAYENTALATEAVLCGCPAVFIPNQHLTHMIALEELGNDGYAWGVDPQEIERARQTVDQGIVNYLRTYEQFWEQLSAFIAVTQARAAETLYTAMVVGDPNWPAAQPWVIRSMVKVVREWRRFKRRLRRWRGQRSL